MTNSNGAHDPEVCIPLREYFEALRAGDLALRGADDRWQAERDRRYAEVKAAEEKALKVKEAADDRALQLAREIQTYKDEKANELREQIASERGIYVTRAELASAVRELQASIKPLTEYASGSTGRTAGALEYRTERRLDIGQMVAIIAVIIAAISVAALILKK